MTNIKYYRSIFISDVHLGFNNSNPRLLLNFLDNNRSDYLYLVGDILDIQRMYKKVHWGTYETDIISKILSVSNCGTQVKYITGNHDSLFRSLIDSNINLGNIELHNKYCHICVKGEKYLVIHGDLVCRSLLKEHKTCIILFLNHCYNIVLNINLIFNSILSRFRLKNINLAGFIKEHMKIITRSINKYEVILAKYAHKNNYDGVICGHIHYPNIRIIDGIFYLNCGDWVENFSAIVEHHDGKWELIRWKFDG